MSGSQLLEALAVVVVGILAALLVDGFRRRSEPRSDSDRWRPAALQVPSWVVAVAALLAVLASIEHHLPGLAGALIAIAIFSYIASGRRVGR